MLRPEAVNALRGLARATGAKLVTAPGSNGDPRDIEGAKVTMTQPFSSLPQQPTRTRLRHRARLLGCSLGCLVTGCAERYDIGAFRDTSPQLQTGEVAPSSPGVGVLLADGVEDADALLDGVNSLAAATPGDLDGDGFDDLVVTGTDDPSSLRILYGGQRPTDGVVRLAGRSSALGLDEYPYYNALGGVPRHGDFDGDGANDLVFSVWENGFSYTYGLSGEAAAERDDLFADLMQRWTEQRAFLWYGSPERPARVDFPSDAVAFRSGDDLSSDLARVLEEHDPNEFEGAISVSLELRWLGDVDGDGHGDLALSTGFSVLWGHEDPSSEGGFAMRTRTQSVTYLYYGGARLEVGGEVGPPDARLSGVTLAGLGDVNGDGLADMVAVTSDGRPQLDQDRAPTYLFAGSAQRLAGDVSLQDLGVPLMITTSQGPFGVGDLDGDGLGDLLSWRFHQDQGSFDLVYGSPDLLQRPLDATRVSATFAGRDLQLDMCDGGDYDGDGTGDLLLWRAFLEGDGSSGYQSDQARLVPGSTTRYEGTFDLDVIQPSTEPRANGWYAALPSPAGDFDGDGLADVVLSNSSDVRIKFGATLQNSVIR